MSSRPDEAMTLNSRKQTYAANFVKLDKIPQWNKSGITNSHTYGQMCVAKLSDYSAGAGTSRNLALAG